MPGALLLRDTAGQFASGGAREFEATHLKAYGAVRLFDAIDIGLIRQWLNLGVWRCRAAARRQSGFDVAPIGKIDPAGAVLLVEGEHLAGNSRRIDTGCPKNDFPLASQWDEEQQAARSKPPSRGGADRPARSIRKLTIPAAAVPGAAAITAMTRRSLRQERAGIGR